MKPIDVTSQELVSDLRSSPPGQNGELIIIFNPPPKDIILSSILDNQSLDIPNSLKASLLEDAISAIQLPAVNFLRAAGIQRITSLWINNCLHIEATAALLLQFLQSTVPDFYAISSVHPNPIFSDNSDDYATTTATPASTKPVSTGSGATAPQPGWNLESIGSLTLNQSPFNLTGSGVTVAVIDRGVNYDHPDLKEQMWKGGIAYPSHGYNVGNFDHDTKDTNDHGTKCASVIAGNGSAGLTTGVAPRATIMIVKIYMPNGLTSQVKMWLGMMFAVSKNCDIISMSQSLSEDIEGIKEAWRRACDTLHCFQVLHFNSSGKNGFLAKTNTPNSLNIPHNLNAPGYCPPPWLHPAQAALHPRGIPSSCITCGSSNFEHHASREPSIGPSTWPDFLFADTYPSGLIKPDLCAPGIDISVCVSSPEYYDIATGSSFAVPHAAGAAALLLEACMRKKNMQYAVEKIFISLSLTCCRLNGQNSSKMNMYGSGTIDVLKAWQFGNRMGWW